MAGMVFAPILRYTRLMYSASTYRRLLECLLVFVALPVVIFCLKPLGYVLAILWFLMAFCAQVLERHYGWTFKQDWNWKGLDRAAVKRIVIRFIPCAIALLWFTQTVLPEQLFSLPKRSIPMWLLLMALYPPLSILPQEVIYRSFFLRRYTPLVQNQDYVRVLCALAFGWMHIIMWNWEAVLLSTIGGVLFADTYQRTRSLAAVCFEHALYGCYVFTIGLGYFFYHANGMR